jgi:hypothetical protein
MEPSRKTPVSNRLFFAIITVFFTLGSAKIVYWAMYQERQPMPLCLWVAIFGTAIAGYFLTNVWGDIKLRLHRIWTPLGILMIIWVCYFMVLIALPKSNSLFDLLFNQSAETYLFAASFGLLIAFVDPNVLYKYSYYLIPMSIFFFVYQLLPTLVTFPMFFIQHGLNITSEKIYEMNDFWVLLSAPLYAYYAIKKFRAERPSRGKIGINIGIFLAFVLVLMLLSHFVFSNLPPSNWFFRWLRA